MSVGEDPPLTQERQEALARLLPRLERATYFAWCQVKAWLPREDAQDVMRGECVEAARDFDPGRVENPREGTLDFDDFVVFRVEAAIMDAARRRANHARLELAVRSAMRRALSSTVDDTDVLKDSDDDRARKRQEWYSVGIAAAVLAGVAEMRAGEDAIVDRETYVRITGVLADARSKLSPRAQKLLELYYDDRESPVTLEEVARQMGLSSATVRNLHRATLVKLGEILRARGVTESPPLEGRPR